MSGTTSGLVNVTNLSVDSITAPSVTADNLKFDNLSVAESISVSGDFSLGGFNTYEGNYKAGDIISYTLKGTMLAGVGNYTWSLLVPIYSGGNYGKYAPLTTYNIDFYEIVYWGVDSRSNDTIRMSATVCVPSTIVSTTVVSYKHGTQASTFQNFTLWQTMQNIINFDIIATFPDLTAWMLATTGYVTVCADNPGYGVSVGNYNFADPTGESYSQYNAVVALKQLIQKKPSLFTTTFPTKLNVISAGYALGGNFCPLVSELIALNTVDFKLVNTIPGGIVNASELLDVALYGDSSGQTLSPNPTTINVLYFTLLVANNNKDIYGPLLNMKPNTKYGVVPYLEQLYLDTTKNNELNDINPYGNTLRIIRLVQNATGGRGIVDASGLSYNYLQFDPRTNPAYVVQSELFNVPNNNILFAKPINFYTNIFEDFSDLSGTPINVMYSLQDELTCYDSSNVNVGNPDKDQVAGPLNTFITTNNAGNGGSNGLSRSSYIASVVDASGDGIDGQMDYAAGLLLASETTYTSRCSNTRWNTSNLGAGNVEGHGLFLYRTYQTVLRKYLVARST